MSSCTEGEADYKKYGTLIGIDIETIPGVQRRG